MNDIEEVKSFSKHNCPHCGADKRPVCADIHRYECGSNRFCNYRSPYCFEREDHNKTRKELAKVMSMIDRKNELRDELSPKNKQLERELNEATELIADIMWDEVNAVDECEKWLRAYAPDRLNLLAPALEEPVIQDSGITEPAETCPSQKDTSTETCPSQKDDQWRELGPDEVIQEGDERTDSLHGLAWRLVENSIGTQPKKWPTLKFRTRRPLPEGAFQNDTFIKTRTSKKDTK